ncbi:Gfo/Idh/MocA family protein [Zavarzinella formosa]|uniref:Gfo/Idh/MocA family protein n=1 Tax=Zavarzinella formosa TaxID=360055 RepID=UPI0002E369B4|nr:Gfo/Idh/MocA family oxidoreductase [Zavarzinella formosa]
MGVNAPLNRKLRMGLIGGGQGSFIGRVHATAGVLDNRAALVAGALSSDPERSKASAGDYDIPLDRAYTSYKEMAATEAKRADKVDFVSVATPNHTHFEIAKTFAEAGINVICDKPLTFDLKQAEELLAVVKKTGVVFGVTHNYTGYPLVRQAREMIQNGELGEINAVRAFYIQGWLRTRLESDNQKQAAWRTDPAKSGIAGCFGDIGTHAYNLGRFITGLIPDQISCQLKIFEAGRALDDYGTAMIKYSNGALGTVTASQISHGRENDLFIEVDGTKGALEWHQEEPNKLIVRKNGDAHKIYTRNGGPYLGAMAGKSSRLPAGHPEAFFEAFANVYTAVYDDIINRETGKTSGGVNTLYPNVFDGVDGMNFITQCVASSQAGAGWVSLKHEACRS